MKIATLNLNGAVYGTQNFNSLRLPKDLFDKEKIKAGLTDKTKMGLKKILEKGDIDIIAIQELINWKKQNVEIKKIIEDEKYELITPSFSRKKMKGFIIKDYRSEFPQFKKIVPKHTVGFIVKLNSVVKDYSLKKSQFKIKKQVKFKGEFIVKEGSGFKGCKLCDGYFLAKNRKAILDFKIEGESYSIINLHINDHNVSIPNFEGNVILLGDLNAFTDKQSVDNKEKNKDFMDRITSKKYVELGEDSDYTWRNSKLQRKLDHIFISEKLAESVDAIKYSSVVTKDDSVNFYYDKGEKEGFTEHSMLILDLEL